MYVKTYRKRKDKYRTISLTNTNAEIFQQNNPGGGVGGDKLKNEQTNKKLFLGKYSYYSRKSYPSIHKFFLFNFAEVKNTLLSERLSHF